MRFRESSVAAGLALVGCATPLSLPPSEIPVFRNYDEIPISCEKLEEIVTKVGYPMDSPEASGDVDFTDELGLAAKQQAIQQGGNALALKHLRHSHSKEWFSWELTSVALRCNTEWNPL